MGTIHLNKESFAARVSDVLESGQWKYLGDKPAIIDFFDYFEFKAAHCDVDSLRMAL